MYKGKHLRTRRVRRRRLIVPLVVVAVLMAMAVPGLAREVSNSSNSGFEVGAWWGPDGSDDLGGVWMGAADNGGQWMGLSYHKTESCPVSAEGVITTDVKVVEPDPDLEVSDGLTVFPTNGKDKLTTANGTGSFLVDVNIDNPCTDGSNFAGQARATVNIALVGDGPLGKRSDSYSDAIPSDSNHHWSSQSTYRQVSGGVFSIYFDAGWDGGDTSFSREFTPADEAFGGEIAATTWRDHRNKK